MRTGQIGLMWLRTYWEPHQGHENHPFIVPHGLGASMRLQVLDTAEREWDFLVCQHGIGNLIYD